MNKTKAIMIAVVLTIVSFIGLVMLEKKLSNYTPMGTVVYSKKDIKRKEALDSSQFELKSVPLTQITVDSIKSLDEIEGKYAVENIYAGEALIKQRIGSREESGNLFVEDGEIEVAFTFQNIADVLGGKLRKDDIVDVLYTSTVSAVNPIAETKIILEDVKVIEARLADGSPIDDTDKLTPTSLIIFAMKTEDVIRLEGYKNKGTIKLVKKPVKTGLNN